MKKTLIPRSRIRRTRTQERGITMLLVAVAMVAIIGMAALSIDVITLYLAREEAQHSADSAAVGAAKVLSLSGITGDPTNVSGNWGHICGPDNGTNGLATRVAKAIATQNAVRRSSSDDDQRHLFGRQRIEHCWNFRLHFIEWHGIRYQPGGDSTNHTDRRP